MAMAGEDAWNERVRDGAKVVVVERRELVRVVALNIFKGWRAQVRGSRICPTNETSVQLAGWLFRRRPKAGRVAADGAEQLAASWLAGRRACIRWAGDSIAIALDMANAERACAHAHRHRRLAALKERG
jgi:hypothetical protein